MTTHATNYLIVGAGLAGASAVEGIRERDKNGTITLIAAEDHIPYHRPPLTKGLWFGKKSVEDIFVKPEPFYENHGVQLLLACQIKAIETDAKYAMDSKGGIYHYDKLMLATGGSPRRLSIPGGDLGGICYYRYLNDYLRLRNGALEDKSALVVGGNFIGSEIAAALCAHGVQVTMIFPSPYLCHRVFPESLGMHIQQKYEDKGIVILSEDKPLSFRQQHDKYVTQTQKGKSIESDMVIVGVGIEPEIALARSAGIVTGDGIVVNEFLQTSQPDIYAAGDNAFFPYAALGRTMRVEHWDNALNQGKWAGRNMAGAHEPYTYMPYFFSDLFEFGYEAVGDVSSKLEMVADWQQKNEKGVIYYMDNDKVRGAMMCNVWDMVPTARELILKGESLTADQVHGRIGE